MMSAQQFQYYSFLERQRKYAMYQHSLTGYYIQMIRNSILKGINPAEDPNLSKIFWVLIDEYGKDLFQDEMALQHLTFEDDTVKKTKG